MPIVLDGSGSITGLNAGGLPDNSVTSAEIASGAVTVSKIDTTVSQLFGMRNRIINGGYDVWQRGTSTTVATGTGNNAYLADRWMIENTSGSTVTATRVANSSNAYGSGNYYINLAIPTFASGGHVDQWQSIESLNIADLAGQTVTLSYYAALSGGSGATLQFQIWIGYPSATDNYTTATYSNPDSKTITSTPTRYTSTFTIPSGATTGLRVYFRINNNGSSTSNATTYTLGGLQLEVGSTATPFERRMYGQELANCQRYYWQQNSETSYAGVASGLMNSTTAARVTLRYPQPMRSIPTISVTSIGSFIVNQGSDLTPSAITAYPNSLSTMIDFTVSGGTLGRGVVLIFNNTSSGSIQASAEL